ncbi:MAG: efflux transporter, family, subunit, partial [Microbacteriaceae bacterium]|nr:efflux transporter, family, subunit [Microbacteriaceae bacterium]
MNKRSRLFLNSGLGVLTLAALVGGYFVVFPPAATSSSASQLTTTVQKGVVSSTITASGAVAAASTVDANFAVSGTIASVDVSLGQTVTAGQQLGTLDTTTLKQAQT